MHPERAAKLPVNLCLHEHSKQDWELHLRIPSQDQNYREQMTMKAPLGFRPEQNKNQADCVMY